MITTIETGFRAAMERAGIAAPAVIVADGDVHPFAPEPNPFWHSAESWYCLHGDAHFPAGAFFDPVTGKTHHWRAEFGQVFDPQRSLAIRAGLQGLRDERQARMRMLRALEALDAATLPATGHAFVIEQGFVPFGVEADPEGRIVVPAYSATSGDLVGVQFIDATGLKTAQDGSDLIGAVFPLAASFPEFWAVSESAIALTPEFEDACSLATGLGTARAVFCTFSAKNLLPVAKALRASRPAADIAIAVMPHHAHEARLAAQAAGAKVFVTGEEPGNVHQSGGAHV